MKILTVVVPCYNEEATLDAVVARVLAADSCGLTLDVVVVDDGSRDGSVAVGRRIAAADPRVRLLEHGQNQGKGAAVRTGFAAAAGDVVLIQDADLEYSPGDYPKLLGPIVDGRADVVYGSRFRTGDAVRVVNFWHSLGNKALTLLSNMMTDLTLTDMETCYKVFRREVVQQVTIVEDRFGFEPEITAKIARLTPAPRICEVGISYDGRTYAEGKKIGWRDGVRAIWCILRYNLAD